MGIRLAKVALGVGLAVALDVLLCLALQPYGGYNETIWSEYRAAKDEDIDTLLVGSSYAELDLNPLAFDESSLGSSSFSLGTPAQCLDDSELAIRTAIHDHHIRRVVLGVEESTFLNDPWASASITFHQAASLGQPPLEAVGTYAHLFTNPYFFQRGYSLAALVPWAMENVGYDSQAIALNIQSRTSGETRLEALARLDPLYHYQGRGYGGAESVLDFSTVGNQVSGKVYNVKGRELSDYSMEALEDLCRLCRDEGVDLYVVCPPQPAFQVLSYGGRYATDMAQVQAVVESYGGHLLDFNLARPSLYAASDDEYFDPEHLNLGGAQRFSTALGDLIARMEAGEDVNQGFFGYRDLHAWYESLSGISLVSLEGEPLGGALVVRASNYSGTRVVAEYRFEVLDAGTGAWQLLRDYSTDPTVTIPTSGNGSITVRVLARTVGSDVEAERACVQELYY